MYTTDAAGNYVQNPLFTMKFPDQLSSYAGPDGHLGKGGNTPCHPHTLSPTHSTLNTQHSTLNLRPSTFDPQSSTLNLRPSTVNARAQELNP